jgi:hypothetical protein
MLCDKKERLTVTLAAYADGTKLPPLVHLPGVRPLPKNEVPNGVVVFMCGSGKKSWANEESINTLGSHPYCLFHWFHIHEIYASG